MTCSAENRPSRAAKVSHSATQPENSELAVAGGKHREAGVVPVRGSCAARENGDMTEELRVRKLVSVFSPEQIAERVRAMAGEIDARYGDEPLVAICVLKGACIFFSDLVRYLHNKNLELDFIRLASYGMGTTSTGRVVLSKDVDNDIHDKHVLLVEDIVDSGRSMRFVLDAFAARGPRSLRLAALVNKTGRRDTEVAVDFAGFSVESGFLVGYGLDYAEHYRGLPGICEIVPE